MATPIRLLAVAGLALLSAATSVGCTSDEPEVSATSTTEQPDDARRGDEPDARFHVAVVSDSEITPEIVELLDKQPDIDVISAVTEPGWRIEQLDDALDEALALEPDVVVYSAGANDLEPLGAAGMLEALEPRLDRIDGASCGVYAMPSVNTSDMDATQAEQVEATLAGFAQVLEDWEVTFVSYPEIAATLEAQNEEFYADGELGSFHPGEAAFAPIAEAMGAAVAACGGADGG